MSKGVEWKMKKGAVEIKGMFLALFLVSMIVSLNIASASISPDTLTATLNPGESISETKTVDLLGVIPKGDIMFSFDCTGSMWDDIEAAKAAAADIIAEIDARVDDAWYGVISYADYNGYFECCGYGAMYGSGDDYPYRLDQPLTDNRTLVIGVIEALPGLYGEDGPEDYTRIFYESYSDPAIGWRAGTRKILINFADAVPHDCDLNEGVPGTTGTWSTGCDPGRDATAGTPDDLDLQTVLAEMAANDVVLLEIHGTGYPIDPHWIYWTGLTGGYAYDLSVVSPEAVAEAVATLIEELALHISTLTLETTPGYEAWLTDVAPPSYTNLTLPVTVTFDIIITVPLEAAPGTYTFSIFAVGDGAYYGEQQVTITVVSPVGGFEVPINKFELVAPWIVLASAISVISLVAVVFVKRRKKK